MKTLVRGQAFAKLHVSPIAPIDGATVGTDAATEDGAQRPGPALEFLMPNPFVTILSVVLAVAGCASFSPPTNTLASSLASVRGAEELGAADVPQAALQLQLAREEIAKARKLMEDGANERAHYMALRAGNDAELAIALVRESHARSAAGQAAKRVDAAKTPEVTP